MTSHIVSDPKILGGEPVIRGTRIPVQRIEFLLKQDFTISAIKNMYPHVPKKSLLGTISEIFESSVKSAKDAQTSS